MSLLKEVVEGRTLRMTFTLKNNGAAFDGAGLTVSNMYLTGRDNTVIDTTGNFGWATIGTSKVYYDPDSADFVASKSPYRVRFELTDGANKIVHYPETAPDEIVVHPAR